MKPEHFEDRAMLLNACDNVAEAKRHLRRVIFRTQRALADAEEGIPLDAHEMEPIAQSLRSLLRQVRSVGDILNEWRKDAARWAELEDASSHASSTASEGLDPTQ
jgi:hypothetical protein